MPENIKLPKLHKIFQKVLGWTNSHLHEFNIGGVKFAIPDPDLVEELDHIHQKNLVLVKALGLDSRCFDYLYDFGDSWHHVVVVEDRYPHRDIVPTFAIYGETILSDGRTVRNDGAASFRLRFF